MRLLHFIPFFPPFISSPRPARKRWKRLGAVVGCALLLALATGREAAALGELVVLKGTVTITRNNQIIRRTAGARIDLEEGDRIRTLWGGKAYLTLFWATAGGEAIMAATSALEVTSSANPEEPSPIRLLEGSMRVRVFQSLGDGPFVTTSAAFGGAAGSDFIVTTFGKERTEFICIQGELQAVSNSDPSQRLILKQRQRGTIRAERSLMESTRVGDTNWFELLDRFSFLQAR